MLPKVPRSSWLQHSQDFLGVISKTRRFVVWGTIESQIPDIDELDKKINRMKRPKTHSIFYAQMSCDSKVITDLTHFRKAGFYDFPAFGVGNKRTLETYISFFLCEEKSMFPKSPLWDFSFVTEFLLRAIQWHSWLFLINWEICIMTPMVRDRQSESDMDHICTSCDVFSPQTIYHHLVQGRTLCRNTGDLFAESFGKKKNERKVAPPPLVNEGCEVSICCEEKKRGKNIQLMEKLWTCARWTAET